MTGAQVAAIPIAAGLEPQTVDIHKLSKGIYLAEIDTQRTKLIVNP
jgi:hypothetical protein